MGQSHSVPITSRKRPLTNSFRSPFRRTNTQSSLSATFNYLEPELKINQLNVNVASEEELMTLPGVTRAIAKNIVEYRAVIGRFNKVEDLALVSGIGADRLDNIRPEICVTKRKMHSCTSSRTQSIDSLMSSEVSPQNPKTPLDVNTASIFQLMGIRGINQELAASIIDYRERRGDFFTLDDLLKVKGMNHVRLGSLRAKLTVKSECVPERKIKSETKPANGKIPGNFLCTPGERKSPCNGEVVKDVYELVSAYCQRPIYPEKDIPKDQFRIATWNLNDMSRSKAENTAVREVFCLTLLENRISFVAVQGVQDAHSLRMICDEMRVPICKRLIEWKGSRGNWVSQFVPMQNTGGKLNLGFLYNAQHLRHVLVKVVQDNSIMLAAEATINFCGMSLDVLNVQLMSNSCDSTLNTLLETIQPTVILGDFSIIKSCDKPLISMSYRALLSPSISTNVLLSRTNPQTNYHDNIFFKESSVSKYAGESDVVRQGLVHLAIPFGWNWNGPVSLHCPVWAQVVL
ncbi:endonuclease/exonuclease/phosphatase family domain-containing protein 1-like isoform X1 [Cimex lectularius]|uniref:Endonuclease/exonuclease/phosphatase family domain-containing protein 1 n=1 Tax=Cimex lectularius TaxID=79782 RepID=A0A8I6S4X5_CIMLE|nr:endonuclease/exonuclease/phosphatase family domain-containing protein 1-like isoform X1 [Cimex lectularius]